MFCHLCITCWAFTMWRRFLVYQVDVRVMGKKLATDETLAEIKLTETISGEAVLRGLAQDLNDI